MHMFGRTANLESFKVNAETEGTSQNKNIPMENNIYSVKRGG